MDLSNLCRSCMKEVASWERENFSKRAVDMFCFCTNIKITGEENLPKQFCYDCVIKIESAFMFIKEAQNVNITLKNIVSRSETSVIIKSENKQVEHHEKPASSSTLKLTLPDYKLCSAIIATTEQVKNILIEANKTNVDIKTQASDVQESLDQDDDVDIPKDNADGDDLSNNVEPIVEKSNKEVVIKTEKKNICPVCRKSFISKIWFAKHMEKHSDQKYTCSKCPKTFSKPSQLAYHLVSHSEERKFCCNVCGKKFKLHKQLKTHAKGHSDVRPFACDKCEMRFKRKSVLKCHMKVHEERKEYLCSFCGWSFAQASNLEVHIRRHTGVKPHACSLCSFRTVSASSLRRHEIRHRDARPFVCKHCRNGFTDASALARHTRTHTGELPYKCPGCPRAFADSWKRKTHLMRTHRIALQDIPPLRLDGQPIDSRTKDS